MRALFGGKNMTDYKALYAQKKLTADEVAARVENGWLIGMDAAIGQTPAIIDAICRKAAGSDLSGVRVQMLLDVYPYAFYADDSLNGKVMGESWFASTACLQLSQTTRAGTPPK